jgi:hypothetical protein
MVEVRRDDLLTEEKRKIDDAPKFFQTGVSF